MGEPPAWSLRLRSRGVLESSSSNAADWGMAPGTVRKLTLTAQELETRPVHPNSLHAAGLMDALGLAAALGTLPAEVTLYGVQPRALEYETGLSQDVRAAIPALVQAIVASLGGQ